MPYQYIRFTSANAPNVGDSRYTVNLPRPIENAVSVHVKSFSMPNTAYNITENNNIIEWYEYNSGSTTITLKSATLNQTKFFAIGELMLDISSAITAAGDFTYSLTQIASTTVVDTYHVNVNVTGLAAGDLWCPLVTRGSIWEMLGFRPNFNVDLTHRGRVNVSLFSGHITDAITSSGDTRWLSATSAGINHVAQFPPRDSHESYHITSSLASAVYEAEADGGSHHTNYLLTVPNNSNRYSWLQYIPTEPVFHDLGGHTISQFTIGLADQYGIYLKNTEHQDFSIVLAIEYRDLHQTLESNQLRTMEWRRSHC